MTAHSAPKTYFVCLVMLSQLSLAACTDTILVNDVGVDDNALDTVSPDTNTDDVLGLPDAGVYSCPDGVGEAVVDVVIALDNSPGMEDEVLMVQEILNPFAAQLALYGMDAHIMIITGGMSVADEKAEKNSICVGAPLGSGNCPEDSNLPEFIHVQQQVESRNALSLIIETFDDWKEGLREVSALHFLVISDDDADIDENVFRERLLDLDPPIDTFFFHAIAAMKEKKDACEETPAGPCCEYSAHEGLVYKSLTEATGGVFEDLCLQNFVSSFTGIAIDIAEKMCPSGNVV